MKFSFERDLLNCNYLASLKVLKTLYKSKIWFCIVIHFVSIDFIVQTII